MAAGRSVVVEFAGLPGSGKSTLSHALAEELRRSGEPVSEVSYEITHRTSPLRRRWIKLGFLLRTLLGQPRRSLEALLEIRRSGQGSLRDSWSTTSNFLYLCGLMAELARRPGIHILDQGVVSALWSVRFSARGERPLRHLAEIASGCFRPVARVVVLLEIRPELAVERLLGRDHVQSRLERRLSGDLPAALLAATAALEQTRSALDELSREGWRGIELVPVRDGGAQGPEARATELAGHVLRLTRGALHPCDRVVRRVGQPGPERDASLPDPAASGSSIRR